MSEAIEDISREYDRLNAKLEQANDPVVAEEIRRDIESLKCEYRKIFGGV